MGDAVSEAAVEIDGDSRAGVAVIGADTLSLTGMSCVAADSVHRFRQMDDGEADIVVAAAGKFLFQLRCSAARAVVSKSQPLRRTGARL